MSLSELLQDVTEQKEKRNLVIDYDSIIFLSAYKYKDNPNSELIYMECMKRIYAIERECWEEYELDEVKIAMTSSTNFRYGLYPEYKANRAKKNEDAELLSKSVKEVKKLIYERLKPILICNSVAEADDSCVELSKQGWLVSAIDSDIIGQSRTPVFNFHSKHWKWVHQGLTEKECFTNTLVDSIKGKSKDNVKGVKGIGEAKAKSFAEELIKGNKDFNDWIDLYDTPADALLNYRLCDCSQVSNGKVNLIEIPELAKLFEEHLCPF